MRTQAGIEGGSRVAGKRSPWNVLKRGKARLIKWPWQREAALKSGRDWMLVSLTQGGPVSSRSCPGHEAIDISRYLWGHAVGAVVSFVEANPQGRVP